MRSPSSFVGDQRLRWLARQQAEPAAAAASCPSLSHPLNDRATIKTTLTLEPIACTLTPGDYKDRAEWIETLAKQSLRSARRTDLILDLTYGPEALEAVQELVRKEQSCNSFLRFDTRQDSDGIHLTITAPERARGAADLLFAHFAPTLTTYQEGVGLSVA